MSNHNPPANGFDKRPAAINKKGRPKSFDALRELAQQIAHEAVKDKSGEPVVVEGHAATVTEIILRKWAASNDPRLQMAFVEVAYGKEAIKAEISGANGGTLDIHVIYDAKPESTG